MGNDNIQVFRLCVVLSISVLVAILTVVNQDQLSFAGENSVITQFTRQKHNIATNTTTNTNATDAARNTSGTVERAKWEKMSLEDYEFVYRGHACAKGHTITQDTSIPHLCMGDEDNVYLQRRDNNVFVFAKGKRYTKDEALEQLQNGDYNASANTCGGNSLEPGACLHYENGTFQPVLRKRGSETKSKSNLSSLPLCRSVDNVFEEGGEFRSTGYQNPKTAYFPNNCSLIPDRQGIIGSLLAAEEEKFRRARIFLTGDSHVRNLFTGLILGVRNQAFGAEGHPQLDVKAQGVVYNYRVWEDNVGTIRDELEVIYAEEGIKPKEYLKQDVHDECEGVYRCVIVAFVWAPIIDEQLALKDIIQAINPMLYVFALNNYAGARVITPEFVDKMSEILSGVASLDSVVFHLWPYGSRALDKKEIMIQKFFQRLRSLDRAEPIVTHYVSIANLNVEAKRAKEGGIQLERTWHSQCTLRDNYPQPIWRIQAFEPCTSLVDKSYARIHITLWIANSRKTLP